MDEIQVVFKQESYNIMAACFDVYKEMGCGFVEAVYQECLEIELERRRLPFRPQSELQLRYKDRLLKQTFYLL